MCLLKISWIWIDGLMDEGRRGLKVDEVGTCPPSQGLEGRGPKVPTLHHLCHAVTVTSCIIH